MATGPDARGRSDPPSADPPSGFLLRFVFYLGLVAVAYATLKGRFDSAFAAFVHATAGIVYRLLDGLGFDTGTSASPAIAFAMSVLPVPGGPLSVSSRFSANNC